MDATAPAILEMGALLLVAALAGWVARKARLPAVIGYLAVGVAISPFTPGYIADRSQLQLLADVGVVILLFEVGIEVDVGRLRRDQAALSWAAPLQVIITTVIAGLAFFLLGLEPIAAALMGLCMAFSSSVVVVNITRSRRRTTDRPTEEAMLGWSVLQDVSAVALAAVLLALLGAETRPIEIALPLLVGFGLCAVIAAWLLPRILLLLRAEHDLFLIVSVASGLALAGLGSVVFGVPLALAAFVAGLAVSESPDAAEARRRLLPFRDLFALLFFVLMGSLIDPAALEAGLGWLLLIVALVLAAKILVIYVLGRVARLRVRPAQLAIGLGQIGEFSFVLGTAALAAGAIPPELFAALLAGVIVTIALSAVAVRLAGTRPGSTAAPDSAAP